MQFGTDPERMPLDRATVRWEESLSPPVPVARITLPPQDVAARHVLHVPEARDPARAEVAIANAIAESPSSEEEVTAGYFAKVDRFPDRS